jgi:hypothetical protein
MTGIGTQAVIDPDRLEEPTIVSDEQQGATCCEIAVSWDDARSREHCPE